MPAGRISTPWSAGDFLNTSANIRFWGCGVGGGGGSNGPFLSEFAADRFRGGQEFRGAGGSDPSLSPASGLKIPRDRDSRSSRGSREAGGSKPLLSSLRSLTPLGLRRPRESRMNWSPLLSPLPSGFCELRRSRGSRPNCSLNSYSWNCNPEGPAPPRRGARAWTGGGWGTGGGGGG